MKRRTMGQAVTAAIAAAALLVGFGLGRFTAGVGSKTESAAGSGETVASAEASTETPVEADTQTEDAAKESTSDTVDYEQHEKDLNSDLVDAADQSYSSSSTDAGTASSQITHEAQVVESQEEIVVDPTEIENPTLAEAQLPEGVASTLYGKRGTALFQVVVLGDSQFGNFLGEDGLAYLLSQKLHANVYNLALGGKCAAAEQEDVGKDISQWGTTCGVNLMKAICGEVDNSCLNGWDYQMNVFNSCDFSKTDLFILEYGANDYLSKKPMYIDEEPSSVYTYYGALESMILDIRNHFPNAQILVCTPTYAQFWQGGTGAFLGDSNIVSNGYGTLFNYVETATHPAGGHKNTSTVNAYENTGIDMYSASEDLLDGLHMTEAGRVKYANLVSRVALRVMGYDIGEGVDPDTVDWVSQKPQVQQ